MYWQSRDTNLLIRGGANYAYEQINEELKALCARGYGLEAADVDVAVVGLRVARLQLVWPRARVALREFWQRGLLI